MMISFIAGSVMMSYIYAAGMPMEYHRNNEFTGMPGKWIERAQNMKGPLSRRSSFAMSDTSSTYFDALSSLHESESKGNSRTPSLESRTEHPQPQPQSRFDYFILSNFLPPSLRKVFDRPDYLGYSEESVRKEITIDEVENEQLQTVIKNLNVKKSADAIVRVSPQDQEAMLEVSVLGAIHVYEESTGILKDIYLNYPVENVAKIIYDKLPLQFGKVKVESVYQLFDVETQARKNEFIYNLKIENGYGNAYARIRQSAGTKNNLFLGIEHLKAETGYGYVKLNAAYKNRFLDIPLFPDPQFYQKLIFEGKFESRYVTDNVSGEQIHIITPASTVTAEKTGNPNEEVKYTVSDMGPRDVEELEMDFNASRSPLVKEQAEYADTGKPLDLVKKKAGTAAKSVIAVGSLIVSAIILGLLMQAIIESSQDNHSK